MRRTSKQFAYNFREDSLHSHRLIVTDNESFVGDGLGEPWLRGGGGCLNSQVTQVSNLVTFILSRSYFRGRSKLPSTFSARNGRKACGSLDISFGDRQTSNGRISTLLTLRMCSNLLANIITSPVHLSCDPLLTLSTYPPPPITKLTR